MGGIYDLDPVSLDFEPNTTVWLYSNVKIRREHQRLFSTVSEQQSYFTEHIFMTFTEQTYQRPDTPFRCRMMYDDILKCNYIGFKNGNFSDKVWYGRITRKEYINAYDSGEADCDIYFELDCIQSYMFDFTFQSAFVERCHQDRFDSSGNPYINDLPEDVITGFEYDVTYDASKSPDGQTYLIGIWSSIALDSDFGVENIPNNTYSGGGYYDNVPSGLKLYAAPMIKNDFDPLKLDGFSDIINALQDYPWVSQGIQSIFVMPTDVSARITSHLKAGKGSSLGEELFTIGVVDSYLFTAANETEFSWREHVPSYNENKLYNYPYTFIEIFNNSGSAVALKPENFSTDGNTIPANVTFKTDACVNGNGRISMYPVNYNKAKDSENGDGYDNMVTIGNFATTNIAVDNYLLYMANNANAFQAAQTNMNLSAQQSVGNSILGAVSTIGQAALSGLGVGMAATIPAALISSAAQIGSGALNAAMDYQKQQNTLLAAQKDAQLNPPSISGQIGGELLSVSNNRYRIGYRVKTVKPWIAEILEDYFHVFGTKRLRTEKPKLYTRSSFDYLKMSNIIIDGDIPEEHERMIKDECATGIWFWHTDDIGNFSVTNGEV